MTKSGYKMTEIGEIPDEWEVVEMGDNNVSELVMGQSPPSSSYNAYADGMPFLQGNADFGEIYPSPSIYCTKPLKFAEKGDILLSVRAPVGELNIAAFKCVIGRGLAAIRCKDKKTHYKYLYYYLKYSANRLRSQSIGSTFKAVGKDILSHFEICLPDYEEQKKIAEILSTADETIQKVDEEITLTEKLKKGLMQTLLTKGIGHTKFKMTEIGEIPEEWKIDKVSNLKESMHYGITAKSTEQRSHLRFLRTTDISNFNFDPNDLHYCEITGTKPDLSKYYLKQGDIIVARAGTVGVSVLVKRDLPNTIFGSYLIKIAFNKDLIYANFVHYYFQSDIYWNKLRAAQGSTIKNISLPFLKALLLPVPPLQEQQKIAEILSTVDHKLELLRNKKTYLERIKKGLMNDLLTGKVRVNINTSEGEN